MKQLADMTLGELAIEHLTYFDLYSALRPMSKLPVDETPVRDSDMARRWRQQKIADRDPDTKLHEAIHGLVHIAFLKGHLPFLPNGNPAAELLVVSTHDLAERAMWMNIEPTYQKFREKIDFYIERNGRKENLILLLVHLLTPKSLHNPEQAAEARAQILYHTDFKSKTLCNLAAKNGIEITVFEDEPGWHRPYRLPNDPFYIPSSFDECKIKIGKKTYRFYPKDSVKNILPSASEGFALFTDLPDDISRKFYELFARPFLQKAHSLREGQVGRYIETSYIARLLDTKISELLPDVSLPRIDGDVQGMFHAASRHTLGYDLPLRANKAEALAGFGLQY